MGKKLLVGIALGLLVAIVIFCIVVLIGCSINKIGFVEQIKDWFGIAKEVVEQTEETTAVIGLLR